MTAYAAAKIPGGLQSPKNSAVTLDFHHQLSAIEIKATGEHSKYNIEIAGVMIGNIYDKGKYSYQSSLDAEGNVTSVGLWITREWNDNFSKFKESRNPVTYIFTDEDPIVPIKQVKDVPETDPRSIMGKGDQAMVIPFRSNAWDNKNDPTNEAKGTYFAVLVHVTDKKTGNQVYPYLSEEQKPEGYQPGLRVAETIGGKKYGWAAIPVKLNLLSGKKYSYTLDFSKGIGVLPPADPDPGKPIFANDHIEISLSVYDWVEEEIEIIPDFGGNEGGDQEGGDQNNGENEN